MGCYCWDAGVVIGYVNWNEENSDVSLVIDPISVHCNCFVHTKAVNCKNIIPRYTNSEVLNRLRRSDSIYKYLVNKMKGGQPRSLPYADQDRANKIFHKLPSDNAAQIIRSMMKIAGLFRARYAQVFRICKLQEYTERLPSNHEHFLGKKLQKTGDVYAYSAAIHHTKHEEPCVFITTDRGDFDGLDCEDLDLGYNYPEIEFVDTYVA